MIRTFMIAVATAAVLTLSPTAFAADHGTADEAKAMLTKAVAALKADKAKTIDLINKVKEDFSIATSTRFALISATVRTLPLATLTQSNC
jgi:hypothetical protein